MLSYVDIFIGLVFIFLLYTYLTSPFTYWKNKGINYVTPTIVFGNIYSILSMKKSITEFYDELYKRCGEDDYIGIWIFRKPALVVKNPEIIKSILVKDFNNFYDRTAYADGSHDPLGSNNLFMIKNPQWKSMRTKLSPIFTSKKMRAMFDLIDRVGVGMVENMKNQIYLEKNSVFEIKDLCSKYTTDTIASVAFGIEANSFTDPNALFLNLGKKMFDFDVIRALETTSIFFAPDIAKLFKFKLFSKKCSEILQKVFWDVIKEREANPIERNDLINTLIELKHDDEFAGDTLLAQAAVFFTAGYETTGNTIAFTLFEIALNTGLQDILYEEISQTIEKHKGKLTYEAIQDMTYLDLCLKETLRKYPPVSFLDRCCQRTCYVLETNDIKIDSGTYIYIPIYAMHMDPVYFPNPERYDPERFSAENMKKITPFTYLPFGEGPRTCIASRLGLLQAKLGLVYLVKHFTIHMTNVTPRKIIMNRKSLSVTPLEALNLQFKLRDI